MTIDAEPVRIAVRDDLEVSARLLRPAGARACYVLAHGAGAGMEHPAMRAVATGLASLGLATLRYQFPYMESGSRRPDPPPLCHATVRAAVAAAAQLAPGLALIAGGRSFGGRMTSQAQSLEPLAGVRGLAFLSFPLHPAGQPSQQRAEHLAKVSIPMLFLSGSRDALAERALLEAVVARLGARATLSLVEEADHSFHVPARSGRSDAQVLSDVLARLATWSDALT
ncbi:MAG TPA: alpha/beta family hydrolase [Steroidobacteraceae bacterium]|jgi:predicted alpha/beta-hydrolase family hydrolase|nr:alpha/beta family hydrolase [Steroidobacteraceae bacterium]